MRAELHKFLTLTSGRVLIWVMVLGCLLMFVAAGVAPASLTALVRSSEMYPDLHLTDITVDAARREAFFAKFVLESPEYQRSLVDVVNIGPTAGVGMIGVSTICAVLLGVFIATGDFRSGGMASTALVTPRRTRLVANKAAAAVAMTSATGVVLMGIAAVVLAVSLALSPDATLQISIADALVIGGRGVLVLVLLSLAGLGLGLALRSQTAAVLVVGGIAILEPLIPLSVHLLTGSVPGATLVGPLAAAHLGPRGSSVGSLFDVSATAVPAVALLLLAGWAVLSLAAGTWRTVRSDLA